MAVYILRIDEIRLMSWEYKYFTLRLIAADTFLWVLQTIGLDVTNSVQL